MNGICRYWDLLIHQITLVLNLYKVLICELRYYDLINFWSQRLLASRFGFFFSIIAIFWQYSINACLINRILSGFNYRMVSFSNIPSLIAPWLRNLLLIWVQLVLPFETAPSIISFVNSIFFQTSIFLRVGFRWLQPSRLGKTGSKWLFFQVSLFNLDCFIQRQ